MRTLMHLDQESLLTEEESALLETIRLKTCEGVVPFQNKQGLPRYNFWQTNPGRHFPNGKWLGRWERFRPPDDTDDSVMIYMMQKRPFEEARWLKDEFDSYANGTRKWIDHVPDYYRNLRAYCSFFNWDMPNGLDACVIANVLYFNNWYGFEENFKQKDSVQYLVEMLTHNDHIFRPEEVAPYYPHTSHILYHLAVLLSRFSIPKLDKKRTKIFADIEKKLKEPVNATERIILENAWMWLSKTTPPPYRGKVDPKPFYFFVLPLTLEFHGALAKWLAQQRITHIRFHCEALEVAFRIENLTLKRSWVDKG